MYIDVLLIMSPSIRWNLVELTFPMDIFRDDKTLSNYLLSLLLFMVCFRFWSSKFCFNIYEWFHFSLYLLVTMVIFYGCSFPKLNNWKAVNLSFRGPGRFASSGCKQYKFRPIIIIIIKFKFVKFFVHLWDVAGRPDGVPTTANKPVSQASQAQVP